MLFSAMKRLRAHLKNVPEHEEHRASGSLADEIKPHAFVTKEEDLLTPKKSKQRRFQPCVALRDVNLSPECKRVVEKYKVKVTSRCLVPRSLNYDGNSSPKKRGSTISKSIATLYNNHVNPQKDDLARILQGSSFN